jgi:hypothetical protein
MVDVKEVGKNMHSLMHNPMLKNLSLITPTQPHFNLAKPANTMEKLKLLDIPLFHLNLHPNLWLQ